MTGRASRGWDALPDECEEALGIQEAKGTLPLWPEVASSLHMKLPEEEPGDSTKGIRGKLASDRKCGQERLTTL